MLGKSLPNTMDQLNNIIANDFQYALYQLSKNQLDVMFAFLLMKLLPRFRLACLHKNKDYTRIIFPLNMRLGSNVQR